MTPEEQEMVALARNCRATNRMPILTFRQIGVLLEVAERFIPLEAAARLIAANPPRYRHERSAVHRCWWCHMPTDAHAADCPLLALRAALKEG